jgi:hypothetical protein
LILLLGNNATTAVEVHNVKSKIKINNLHDIFGHCGKAVARMTGKRYGYDVMSDFKTCEDCSVAKARQKNFYKD